MKETALLALSLLSRDAGVALHAGLWSVTSFLMKGTVLYVRKPVAGRRIVVDTVVASAVVRCPSLAATNFLAMIGIPIFVQYLVASGCGVGITRASCYVIAAIAHNALRPSSLT